MDNDELANDIYMHLKVAQLKQRPNISYLKTTQYNVSSEDREEVINRLAVLSDYFYLVPGTLYSAVGYMDLYLSGYMAQGMDETLLVALSCLFLAAKYHGRPYRPSLQRFCDAFYAFYDGKYDLREFEIEEIVQMENDIVRFLNFQLTIPTVNDFLDIFVPHVITKEIVAVNDFTFRCLTDYIGELHLLDYSMICYVPSMVAASAVFLAKFIIRPDLNPWNTALSEATEYNAFDIKGCIQALHSLYCKNSKDVNWKNFKDLNAYAITKKYGRKEYNFVAKIGCPENIPGEFFM